MQDRWFGLVGGRVARGRGWKVMYLSKIRKKNDASQKVVSLLGSGTEKFRNLDSHSVTKPKD